jgi:dsRNA-specific ribonuclease
VSLSSSSSTKFLRKDADSLYSFESSTFRLCTNAIAAELAIEVGLDDGTQRAQAADRFEAYLAALSFSNGRQSLLQFLVPFVQREFSARFNSVPALSSHQEE